MEVNFPAFAAFVRSAIFASTWGGQVTEVMCGSLLADEAT
jgi:hypothetical protein